MSWVSRWTLWDSRTLLLCRWLSGRCCFTLTTTCAETPNGVEIIWPVRKKKKAAGAAPPAFCIPSKGAVKLWLTLPTASACLLAGSAVSLQKLRPGLASCQRRLLPPHRRRRRGRCVCTTNFTLAPIKMENCEGATAAAPHACPRLSELTPVCTLEPSDGWRDFDDAQLLLCHYWFHIVFRCMLRFSKNSVTFPGYCSSTMTTDPCVIE